MAMTDQERDYRKHYNRGWAASQRLNHSTALERADNRGESSAWYDGYEDYAINENQKWCSLPDGYRK